MIEGKRGDHVVKDMTMRDLKYVLLRAVVLADMNIPLETKEAIRKDLNYEITGYDAELLCRRINCAALLTNFVCELEKTEGIYPNIPDWNGGGDPQDPVLWHPV